jgi:hypothetical protein
MFFEAKRACSPSGIEKLSPEMRVRSVQSSREKQRQFASSLANQGNAFTT